MFEKRVGTSRFAAAALVLIMCMSMVFVTGDTEGGSDVSVESEPERTVGYVWHNMFNEPFGEWWGYRHSMDVWSDAYPYIFRSLGPFGETTYASNMRLNVMANDLPEVNMNDNPQFLPYLGTVRGGTAIIDWHLQFATYDEISYNPMLANWYDGWMTIMTGTAVLDDTAAMAVLGVSEQGLTDFDLWWAENEVQVNYEYVDWLRYEGGIDRLDIYPMYDWYLQPMVHDIDAVRIGENIVVSYDITSWGMEALMTRWLHEAFMPTEWDFEDFTLHAEIFPDMADIDVDTVVVGAVFAWQDIETNRPSWVWRGMLQDYIQSSLEHPESDFDLYADREYMDMYTGCPFYGYMIPFDYTPGAFNLSDGEELIIEWPTGSQAFLTCEEGEEPTMVQMLMASPYSEPSELDLSPSVDVDPELSTISFFGPLDVYSWSEEQQVHEYLASEWDRLEMLPYGMPWISFGASSSAEPPVASIAYSPAHPEPGEAVLFDTGASYDPDGWINTYVLDFGDGSVEYTPYTETYHTYACEGVYSVSLTVIDNEGLTGSTTATIHVGGEPLPPVAILTYAPEDPYEGETVTFDASASYDPDGYVTEYTWQFGDGSGAGGAVVEHEYWLAGTYDVTLTVTDSEGLTDEAVVGITVIRPPSASISYYPSTPKVGELVTFSADGSDDPEHVVECRWYFSDNTTATGWEVTHVFLGHGDYIVILDLEYSYGIAASAAVVVKVSESGSSVKGTVVSENLKPMKDALVRICSSDGELLTSTVTDRDGEFLFSDLAPGDYWLLISKNGYETTMMSVTVGAGVLDVGMIILEKDRQAGNDLLAVDSELLEKVCSGGP